MMKPKDGLATAPKDGAAPKEEVMPSRVDEGTWVWLAKELKAECDRVDIL